MSLKYSTGPQPVSTTIASIAGGTGLTTFTITSAAGLPTVVAGELAYLRIADGTASAETLSYTISGTTVTCSATGFSHTAGDALAFDILSGGAITKIKDDAISGFPENALSAAGALVKGTGVTNRITLTSAAATFTLADGAYKGEICRILIDRTSTKLVTIDPAGSTTIEGLTTIVMWAGESGLFAWNGSAWEKRAGVSRPMNCSMYLAASTSSFADNVMTQILIDSVGRDNTGLMANTGANKMTVQRTGLYLVNGSAIMNIASVTVPLMQAVVKQGATIIASGFSSSAAVTGGGWCHGKQTTTVFLTAGDDITLHGYQNSTTTTPYIYGGIDTHLTLVEQIGG